jgi:dTDP-4-dehydrorhamnose reductase
MVKNSLNSQTLNFGGKERVSRLELGERLCDIAGFDKSLLKSISMNEIKTAHKVADVSMDTERLRSLGFVQRSIDESIREILEMEI